jgi:hypothetical protein
MCSKCIGLEDQITRYLGFARGVDALTRGRIYDLVSPESKRSDCARRGYGPAGGAYVDCHLHSGDPLDSVCYLLRGETLPGPVRWHVNLSRSNNRDPRHRRCVLSRQHPSADHHRRRMHGARRVRSTRMALGASCGRARRYRSRLRPLRMTMAGSQIRCRGVTPALQNPGGTTSTDTLPIAGSGSFLTIRRSLNSQYCCSGRDRVMWCRLRRSANDIH